MDKMNGFRSIMRTGLVVALLGAVGGCPWGCSSGKPRGGASLTAADFAAGPQEAPAISAAPVAHTPADPPQPANITGPVAVSEGVVDVVATPGAPELPKGPRPDPVGGP